MTVVCQGQETYKGFFSEGKTWVYERYEKPTLNPMNVGRYPMTISVKGDTLIGDWKCKRVYMSANDATELFFCGYEEQGKVYRIDIGSDIPRLIYDFTLQPGDATPLLAYKDDDYDITMNVSRIDTVDVRGLRFKRFHFVRHGDDVDVEDPFEEKWVEGIGNDNGLFTPYCVPASMPYAFNIEFKYCEDRDGNELFSVYDFTKNAVMDVSPVARAIVPDGTVYDLQGRRVQAPQRDGLYVTGGKKFIYR
ncbi:MAG: hypothetical protein IJK42_12390 [Prevotella sp.]|nr:hypothetical protein [Prevotella sp.]